MLLKGKRGLICGVANQRSAAWAVAQSCLAQGAEVALGYRAERELENIEKLVADLEPRPLLLPCDVTRDEDLTALRETLADRWGKLDFLVHSLAFANIEDLKGRFTDTSREGFLLAHDVSAYSLTLLARTVEPLMSGGGSIITLSYIGAHRAVPNYNVMGVAKASLEASVRYLAHELGPQQIRVNTVSAGPMRTLAAAAIGDFKLMFRHHAEISPLRRNTTQEEVGDVVAFLASDLSRGMTGCVLYVDEGYHIMAQ